MSRENVEVVQTGWEAWQKGDLDAVCATWDPAVEWDTTNFADWPENAVYRGEDEVRRFLEEWVDTWDRYESGVDAFVDAGDRVLVLCWQRGFGRESEVPVQIEMAQVFTIRHGRVVRIDNYTDRTQAFEAVGLREEAGGSRAP
jgi:ketosteroid isomerase-like protein